MDWLFAGFMIGLGLALAAAAIGLLRMTGRFVVRHWQWVAWIAFFCTAKYVLPHFLN